MRIVETKLNEGRNKDKDQLRQNIEVGDTVKLVSTNNTIKNWVNGPHILTRIKKWSVGSVG